MGNLWYKLWELQHTFIKAPLCTISKLKDWKWRCSECKEYLTIDQQSKVELLAKVLEYEHALEHIATDHGIDGMSQGPDYPFCEDCESLAKSALDLVNHEMCLEDAADLLAKHD